MKNSLFFFFFKYRRNNHWRLQLHWCLGIKPWPLHLSIPGCVRRLSLNSAPAPSSISTSEALTPQKPPRDPKRLQVALPLLCPRKSENSGPHRVNGGCIAWHEGGTTFWMSTIKNVQFTLTFYQMRCCQRKTLLCCSSIWVHDRPLCSSATPLLLCPLPLDFHLQTEINCKRSCVFNHPKCYTQ